MSLYVRLLFFFNDCWLFVILEGATTNYNHSKKENLLK